MRDGHGEISAARSLPTLSLPEGTRGERRPVVLTPAATRLASGRRSLACALVCGLGLVGGCSKSEPKPYKPPHHHLPHGLAAYVLDKAPAMSHPLDVRFDDQVFLLGYDVSPAGPVTPDTPVTLTLYWRLDERLTGNWKLSTLVIDDHDHTVLDLYNASPIRAGRHGHPRFRPSYWSLGKVYVDKLSFKLPANVTARHLRVIASVYSNRTSHMNVTRGSAERPGYAPVMDFDVAIEKPTASLPELEPGTQIAIDGKLDEKAWQDAPALGPLMRVQADDPGQKPAIAGKARLLWDAHALYVGYEVKDHDVLGEAKPPAADPDLSKGDAVALVVDPDGDGKPDYEIQINPQNAIYDARRVTSSAASSEKPAQTEAQKSWRSGVRSAAVVEGTVNKSDDQDQGYVIEARIPWQSFGQVRPKPPVVGDDWKLNVYAMRDGKAIGWAPLFGKEDVATAARFGTVKLAARPSTAAAEVAATATATAKNAATVAPTTPATNSPPGPKKTASAEATKSAER